MTERNKAVPAAYLILKKDGDILLGRRINTGYYDGYYTLPSGHIESGELPTAGLVRETKEEIGLGILSENAKLVHVMYREKHDETGQRVDFFFSVEKWSGEVMNNEPLKCDDLAWFAPDNLPKNMMHHVRYALECIQKGIDYSEVPYREEWLNPNAKQ